MGFGIKREEIKNMNKRIKSIIATVTVLVVGAFSLGYLHAEEVKAFDQCSGTYKTYTSEMKKPIKIKESKLTSLRYLKKICQITDTYKGEDYTAYELDNGKGRFIKYKGGHKVCLLVKDGELYGRWAELSQRGAALTYNLHDKRCYQRTHSESYGNWTYTYYFSTDALEHNAEILKTRMVRLAKTWGLTN